MSQRRIFDGVISTPASYNPPPLHAEVGERFYQGVIGLAKVVLRLQGIRIYIEGAENIPAYGGALLAMNHTGYYDFIFGGAPAALRGRRLMRFMAKKEIFAVAGLGRLMRMMHHVSVDRSQGAASIDEAVAHLEAGRLVGIFPEATISRSFELKDFKSGAARIAKLANVPLIPMVCWGSQRIWTKGGKKHLGRTNTPIHMVVGKPVDVTGEPDEVTRRLKAEMGAMLERVRADYDAEHGPFPDGLAWRPASLNGTAPTLDEANRMDEAERAERRARKEKEQERKALIKERKADAKLAKRAQKQLNKLASWAKREQR